jgi:mannose-6-phosphate isomerase-like protein (cupin superfamily)
MTTSLQLARQHAMERVVVALVALLSAASRAPAAAPDEGPPVSMEATSWHVPVIRNKYVTIFRVDIPAGRASNYHIHDRDQVCVVVEDYPPEAYSQPLGGPPGKPRQAVRGEVSYVSYFGKPITHKAINAGTLSNHSICTVFNEPKAAGFTVDVRNAQSYQQLLDNERVRAWRLVLKPGETAPSITQRAPGLRVIIGGGQITEILPGGRERGMALRQGEFYWQPPGGTRGVRNIGSTPVEIVEYEFK